MSGAPFGIGVFLIVGGHDKNALHLIISKTSMPLLITQLIQGMAMVN